MTDTYSYDAWGNSFGSTGPTPSVHLYRGEQYDADLMLYYLRARYFNPLSGRFLSRSPEHGDVEKPKSLHAYLYVEGDPVNYMDPTGHPEIVEYESQEASSGLQSHHLIEQRLAANLVKVQSKLVCILGGSRSAHRGPSALHEGVEATTPLQKARPAVALLH